MKKVMLLFMIFISLFYVSFAHSGRTDSNGGHYSSSAGEYHYHHGYSAHQHNEDGSCPYEINENSNKESSSFNINNNINKVVENININDLELQIQAKQSTIGKLNNEIDKKEKEIQNLKNSKINMWIIFIFLLILSIYLSYKIGMNKKVN